MKKIVIAIALVSLHACNNSNPAALNENRSIDIRTIDKQRNAFKVQSIEWWYKDRPKTKFELHCKNGICSEWVVNNKFPGAIVVHADRSVVQENDEECWDLYEGQKTIAQGQHQAELVLSYRISACK